ncbi:MAG: hypothetical protein IJY93_02210 [Clostridia bacterium]|nr:hypothetical protein [Clostridia bacterium]
MRNILYRIRTTLARFFYGRYGVDKLGYAILIVSMILSLASSFCAVASPRVSLILYVISYGLLIWMLFRMLSKNRAARANENAKFLGFWKGIKKWFKLQYNRIKDIRTHRYFACPNCKNNLRVPKGRGEITITCPVCKTKFDRKT